jgi:mannose-1-phosphate guanylyltransferase/mannose-6-phosphate isomerase
MEQCPLVPVILCGGSGTRLWPLSRESFPKQFLRLQGDHSLLQQTLLRCEGLCDVSPLLLSGEASRHIITEQLAEIGAHDAMLMLEPTQRGTAPALACAALQLMRTHGDALMLVLPSDHIMRDAEAFRRAVHKATLAAREGLLMTFGIPPTAPETGYGYLRAGAALAEDTYRIVAFHEKPDRNTAQHLIDSGHCYWNGGMFVFRCSQLIDELEQHAPSVMQACHDTLETSSMDGSCVRLDAQTYTTSPDLSIDYALMERTSYAAMVVLDAGWSDIGSWASVWESAVHDQSGNSVQGDVLIDDCHNCHIHSEKRLVSAIGLDELVIVDTDDALLVLPKSRAQDIRRIVKRLRDEQRTEGSTHRQVMRPWGRYDALEQGPRFQVKRITVKPGAKLSLQMHHHRAEHWIVVSGTARVTEGEKEYLLTENQGTYISVGVVHSLENPGKIPLELIEVQSGSYLGEDDIVRLSDVYGRC